MIFTAANALSVIAGVILISLLAGLWPITLCFAFNLAYRLVTLIKKRAPSPAERRVHAAALAAVLLLIILLGSAKILAALSNGSLAPIMYVLSGGALVFAMLTLFAEAWYEALAARRAARTAGRKALQYPFPANAPGISAVHCEVRPGAGGVFLADLGSSYGTFLPGGKRLEPGRPVPLGRGGAFYLASGENQFVIR